MRFGRILVRVKYDGQKPTCRRCGDPDHFADVCSQIVCFNCEELGHEVGHCPRPRRCCFCKTEGHLGKYCHLSWARNPIFTSTSTENESVNVFSPSPECESDNLVEELQEQLPLISAVLNADTINVDVNDVVLIIESPEPVEENVVEDCEAIPVNNDADLITVCEGEIQESMEECVESEKEEVIAPTPPAAKIPSSGRRPASLINSVQVPGRISTMPVAVPTKSKPATDDVSSDEIGTFSSSNLI